MNFHATTALLSFSAQNADDPNRVNVFSLVQNRWQERKRFARLRDWLISLYDVGLRLGPRVPLPLRNRPWPVKVREQSDPLYLRLGRSDGFVLKEIFLENVYGPTLANLQGPVRQIVDLGANVGLSVRLWLEKFPDAKILAVEPDPGNFETLKQNITATQQAMNRAFIFRVCVAGKPGKVYLDRSAEDCAIHVTDQPTGDPVDAKTLPTLLDNARFTGDIDLLKMDIEGAEADVLADCSGWIGRVKLFVIELHGTYTQPRLMEDLARNGGQFDLVHADETAGNPLLVLRRAR